MPAQEQGPAWPDPPPNLSFVRFSERGADQFIVRDIWSGIGAPRWALEHPELKFTVQPKPNLRFVLSFDIHERTFRATGPVTLRVKINGHALPPFLCPHAGGYRMEQPVPSDWIQDGKDVRVLAEASPLWLSPEDGSRLGYLIREAGFL